jgi:hypothetical protein
MAQIPCWKDVGKASNDLLSKDFPISGTSLEVKVNLSLFLIYSTSFPLLSPNSSPFFFSNTSGLSTCYIPHPSTNKILQKTSFLASKQVLKRPRNHEGERVFGSPDSRCSP